MNRFIMPALAAFAAILCTAGAFRAEAQWSINIGVAPSCPYGYYDYAPYRCAPYGYYGPEWFHGHKFIGVGPWFRGTNEFHGHVNNNFDPQHGYNGRIPDNGERAHGRARAPKRFQGNEVRDGRGHGDGDKHEGGDRH
jgi:hypothetical protein